MMYLVFHNDFLCHNQDISIIYFSCGGNGFHIYPKLIKKNWAAAPFILCFEFRCAVRMRKAFVSFPRRSWC